VIYEPLLRLCTPRPSGSGRRGLRQLDGAQLVLPPLAHPYWLDDGHRLESGGPYEASDHGTEGGGLLDMTGLSGEEGVTTIFSSFILAMSDGSSTLLSDDALTLVYSGGAPIARSGTGVLRRNGDALDDDGSVRSQAVVAAQGQ
jgi:hypothetical protein